MMSRSRGSRRMYRGGWTWQHQARGTATNMEQPTWGTRCSRLDADMLGSRRSCFVCLPAYPLGIRGDGGGGGRATLDEAQAAR
jgi:hypothetical protein